VHKADNLPPSCAVVTKSGKLNFLEPSGHLGSVMGLLYLPYLFSDMRYIPHKGCASNVTEELYILR